MGYYPINIDITGQSVLVVGGGSVAERKVRILLEFGAKITVVAPEITNFLRDLTKAGQIVWMSRAWMPEDLDGMCLVFAATDDRKVNQEIFNESKSRGILLNCVDQPDLCSFTIPALVKRDNLLIAISTSGKSPSMASWVRKDLENKYGEEYGKLTEMAGTIRKKLFEKGKSPEDLKDKFVRLDYDWSVDQVGQQGSLIIGFLSALLNFFSALSAYQR